MRDGSKYMWIVLAMFLSSCTSETWVNQFVPKDEDRFARSFIDTIHQSDYPAALSVLDSTAIRDDSVTLKSLCQLLPRDTISSMKLVGSIVGTRNSVTRSYLSYEIEYRAKWRLVDLSTVRSNGKMRITRYRFTYLDMPLEQLNAFSFTGKTGWHYLLFGVGVLIVAIVLTALVLCIQSKVSKMWAWILVVVISWGQLSMNWTTGDVEFKFFTMQFLGIGAVKSAPYGPWLFSISIPVGALIFLWHLRKKRTANQIPLMVANSSQDVGA